VPPRGGERIVQKRSAGRGDCPRSRSTLVIPPIAARPSIADRFRICRAYAEKQGWQIVEKYSDHAISGASLLRAGEVLRSLVKGIILTPEEGELQIDVCGDLAGIHAISLKTKTPATRTGGSQFEVVAGARNARYLQLIDRQIPWVFPPTPRFPSVVLQPKPLRKVWC